MLTIDLDQAKLSGAITRTGYGPINDLSMYYQIEGSGRPLVFLSMGFGVAALADFSSVTNRYSVISVDLQGRRRTADTDRPLTFEQQAEDVVALLHYLEIAHADFLGECSGGIVATLIAARHPEMVGRVATYGTVFSQFQKGFKPELLTNFPDAHSDVF